MKEMATIGFFVRQGMRLVFIRRKREEVYPYEPPVKKPAEKEIEHIKLKEEQELKAKQVGDVFWVFI